MHIANTSFRPGPIPILTSIDSSLFPALLLIGMLFHIELWTLPGTTSLLVLNINVDHCLRSTCVIIIIVIL